MASKELCCSNIPKYCTCICTLDNIYDFPELKEMLPVNYNYTVCAWFRENEKDFECRFRVNVSTKDGALAWLEEFKRSSNTFYTIDRTFPENTQNRVYKIIMKCFRNTRPKYNTKQAHSQHTNCRARLTITVRRSINTRSKDVHLQDFPMVVLYRHKHNHDSNPIKALQKHSTNPEVTDIFIRYFKEGLSPSKAIEQYTVYLKEKYGDEYYKALKDERLFPDRSSVYRLYENAFNKTYSNSKRKQMLQTLQSQVEKFNIDMKGRFSELRIFNGEDFVVVIVSPLMQRVLLNIPETSDILFMDSFDNADNYQSKLFVFLTKSKYGALPVCSVILSSYSETLLSEAFNLFKTFLKSTFFAGRGLLGPKIFMVEDNDLIKSCISKAFPSAFIILNTQLLLRDLWKYLVDANVPLRNLQPLLFKMKEIMYCDSEEKLDLTYSKLRSSPLVTAFPFYMSYIEKLYASKEEWAKCLLQTSLSSEQKINDLSVQTIDVFEDNIMQMKKVYCVENLFNYIVSDLDQFYKDKLLHTINNQYYHQNPKNIFNDVKFKERQLLEYGTKSFVVKSIVGKRDYFVELDIGVCNCKTGKSGANCEHQAYVTGKCCKLTFSNVPISLEEKVILHYIGTGEIEILHSYLATQCDKNEEKLDEESQAVILEPNATAILEFEELLDNQEGDFYTKSTSDNLGLKQSGKIETLNPFYEAIKTIANQAKDTNSATLVNAKQLINDFRQVKENSTILSMNCFLNDSANLDYHSTTLDYQDINDDESILGSSIFNEKCFTQDGTNNNENSISKSKPNKRLRTTAPLIVHISQKDVIK